MSTAIRGRRDGARRGRGQMLTVVFERRPPSPSIQTSEIGHERTEHFGMSSRTRRTRSLDLFTLGEGEVGSKEIGAVLVGHGCRGWGRRSGGSGMRKKRSSQDYRRSGACLRLFVWGRDGLSSRALHRREAGDRARVCAAVPLSAPPPSLRLIA